MSFLDNLGKSLSQGIDRAKFEADKFQKVTRIQGELGDLKKQVETRRLEFGDRAMELYKAGKIQSPTLGEILRAIEALHVSITLKEEEYKTAQGETFSGVAPSPPPSQQVPVSVEPPTEPIGPTASAPPPTPVGGKVCPNCGFQTPSTSMFCPNCGTRVGV